MKTHLIDFQHMTCGCQVDDDPRFLRVCDLHFHAPKLLHGCQLALHKPTEEVTTEFLTSVIRRATGE